LHRIAAWIASGAVWTVACAPVPKDASSTQNLSYDTGSRANRAVLFIGNAENIPGVFQDPPNLERALTNPQYNFNFKVTRADRPMTVDEIKAGAAQAAKDMIDGNDKDAKGTYFFYFSGHGAETGELLAADRTFYFKEVADAIKKARGNRAFKRLVIFVDACFSGNLVDGTGAVSNADGGAGGFALAPGAIGGVGLPKVGIDDQAASRYLKALNAFADSVVSLRSGLYEQLVLISSSRKTETSGDSGNGGIGTLAFIDALRTLGSSEGATIRMLAEGTVSNATGQTPVYRIEPPEVADEPLFGDNSSSGASSDGATQDSLGPGSKSSAVSRPNTDTIAGDTGLKSLFDLTASYRGGSQSRAQQDAVRQ
jgi:hypothetical protein